MYSQTLFQSLSLCWLIQGKTVVTTWLIGVRDASIFSIEIAVDYPEAPSSSSGL